MSVCGDSWVGGSGGVGLGGGRGRVHRFMAADSEMQSTLVNVYRYICMCVFMCAC